MISLPRGECDREARPVLSPYPTSKSMPGSVLVHEPSRIDYAERVRLSRYHCQRLSSTQLSTAAGQRTPLVRIVLLIVQIAIIYTLRVGNMIHRMGGGKSEVASVVVEAYKCIIARVPGGAAQGAPRCAYRTRASGSHSAARPTHLR